MNRLAVALVVAVTMRAMVGATPQTSIEITSKNVRQAEAKAKSAEDHRKIAEYYEDQTKLMQAKLADAEDLVSYWSRNTAFVNSSNAPNPYWSARNRADSLRGELASASARAAEQQKLAQSAR